MRKWIFVGALGLAAFLVVRSQLSVSSQVNSTAPEAEEEVRSLLLRSALLYFQTDVGRPPTSLQELQEHPAGKALNIWDFVVALQEGEEPPPGYAGWRIENGEFVLYHRLRSTLRRTKRFPVLEKESTVSRATRQRFAPSAEDAQMYYICQYLYVLGKYGRESLDWFRSPYEGQTLQWSSLDDPKPGSITRLQIPRFPSPDFVCWNADRKPVNPQVLSTYLQYGGTLPDALLSFAQEYQQWLDSNPDYLFTPEEIRASGS